MREVRQAAIGLFGEPGAGKTGNSRMLCHHMAEAAGIVDDYKALIIDFESPRATENILSMYPAIADHFDVLDVLVEGIGDVSQINNISKKDLFADFNIIGIDWLASLYNLNQIIRSLVTKLKPGESDYDFLVADGLLSPAIKQLGESRFNEMNPGRDDPNQLDHVEIGKLETLVFNAFSIAARKAWIPFIVTGKMKDVYEKSDRGQMEKTGKVAFYCNQQTYGNLTIALEIKKPVPKRVAANTNRFTVSCYKASAPGGYSWQADLMPGYIDQNGGRYELFDLIKKYEGFGDFTQW